MAIRYTVKVIQKIACVAASVFFLASPAYVVGSSRLCVSSNSCNYLNQILVDNNISDVSEMRIDTCPALRVEIDLNNDSSLAGSCVVIKREKIVDDKGNVSYKYLAITCYHVLAPMKETPILIEESRVCIPYLKDGVGILEYPPEEKKEYTPSFTLRCGSKDLDIAVIEFSSAKLIGVADLSVTQVKSFERIYTLAYPAVEGLLMTEGRTGYKCPNKWWSTSACVYPGASGGPVFNSETGQLEGIIVGLNFDTTSNVYILFMSYIIPSNVIIPWLMQEKVL